MIAAARFGGVQQAHGLFRKHLVFIQKRPQAFIIENIGENMAVCIECKVDKPGNRDGFCATGLFHFQQAIHGKQFHTGQHGQPHCKEVQFIEILGATDEFGGEAGPPTSCQLNAAIPAIGDPRLLERIMKLCPGCRKLQCDSSFISSGSAVADFNLKRFFLIIQFGTS